MFTRLNLHRDNELVLVDAGGVRSSSKGTRCTFNFRIGVRRLYYRHHSHMAGIGQVYSGPERSLHRRPEHPAPLRLLVSRQRSLLAGRASRDCGKSFKRSAWSTRVRHVWEGPYRFLLTCYYYHISHMIPIPGNRNALPPSPKPLHWARRPRYPRPVSQNPAPSPPMRYYRAVSLASLSIPLEHSAERKHLQWHLCPQHRCIPGSFPRHGHSYRG